MSSCKRWTEKLEVNQNKKNKKNTLVQMSFGSLWLDSETSSPLPAPLGCSHFVCVSCVCLLLIVLGQRFWTDAQAEAMNFRGKELSDAYQAKRDLEEKEKVRFPSLPPRQLCIILPTVFHHVFVWRVVVVDGGIGVVVLCCCCCFWLCDCSMVLLIVPRYVAERFV